MLSLVRSSVNSVEPRRGRYDAYQQQTWSVDWLLRLATNRISRDVLRVARSLAARIFDNREAL
jgi:hypothetical protein